MRYSITSVLFLKQTSRAILQACIHQRHNKIRNHVKAAALGILIPRAAVFVFCCSFVSVTLNLRYCYPFPVLFETENSEIPENILALYLIYQQYQR